MDEKGLGKRLQQVRREKGLTQQELCQRANLSYSTLAKIERGAIKSPSIFTIQSIAVVLGVTLDELVGGVSATAETRQLGRTKSGVSFVYFDLNDTLIQAAQRAFTLLAERSGVPPDIIETMFWHYNDALNTGTMSLSDFNEVLSRRLGMSVDWTQAYMESAVPITPVQEVLVWAAEKYRVGLLTNTLPGIVSGVFQRGILPKVTFDVIIDSSEVGLAKPDPRIFELAQERAGVPAGQILLVDDARANVVAAEQQGWHVARFDAYQVDESAERLRMALQPEA